MTKLAIRLSSLFMAVFLFTGFANAQERLTLEEAIDIALQQNVTIQQAKNNLGRNQADLRSAYGAFLPNLNGTSNANMNTGQQFNQSTLRFETQTSYSMSGGLSTNVPIFTGWQNISNLRRARIDQDVSQSDYDRLKEDLIFETASEFLQVLLNEQLLGIAKENLETSQKQLEQVDAQVEVGMRPIVDLFNQEAVVANNELLVIQRENALKLSKVRVTRILQLDPLVEYEFVTPGIDEQNITPQIFDLTELIETALANRKDIKSQELRILSTQQALRGARSGWWPRLSAGANLNTNYSDTYFQGTRSFSEQFFDERITYSVGFSLQIPIFDRFQTSSNVANRRIDMKNAVLGLQDRKSLVFQEISQAYNDYVSYAQELASTEKALIAAEKAFETQQERYNVGSATLIELTTANNEFVNAASNRVQVIYRFVFQEKLLDYYLGRITDDISF
jgi:outer membrane protein